MGKNYNRREFLHSSLLGLGSLFVINSPIKLFANHSYNTTGNQTDLNRTIDANLLNKQAKEFFYKKKYAEATSIYQQLIALFPDRISYYDGYARVLGAQQKTLDTAELYRQGLLTNPDAPLFMHRLSMRMIDLSMGNKKAELAFVNKYGENNILEASALLLLKAIALKQSNKGLYLNLRDILNIIDKRNKALTEKGEQLLVFSDKLRAEILSTTSVYESKWVLTRQTQKKSIPENAIDAEVVNLINKKRRELNSTKEKEEREKAIKKEKKLRWKLGLEKNIINANPARVEKFGILILEENIMDTDTIGKLRKYYQKNKLKNRLLSLNRYLYIKNNSLSNSLALATTLCNYGDNKSDLTEANHLLSSLTPYVNTLPSVSIGAYYQTSAQLLKQLNQPANARTMLLEGLSKFDGIGGVSYSLFEKYAQSFSGKKMSIGIDILKALCGKEVKPIDDPVWNYIKAYLQTQKDKTPSVAEQLKPLYALAKLQNKAGSTEYALSKSEIETLRSKIYK
ncbi:MAG: hypothetical protein Q7U47_04740 [Paludibacter sp.]|nr:hypothetical protein [Paludibacter sp.]